MMNTSTNEWNEWLTKFTQGVDNLSRVGEVKIGVSAKEKVFQTDRVTLYRYKSLTDSQHRIPVLIVYALVNRYTMLDLHENKSLVRNLLKEGLDIYLIDWGNPSRADRYTTMSDHIDGYLNDCVDYIRQTHNLEKINILGVCQGGTFSTIYTSLYPEKVEAFIPTVTPIDFDHTESLLNVWCKNLDVDALVDSFGNISGDFMNFGYQMLKPVALNVQKYIDLLQIMPDAKKLDDFMRMEKWIFDSPDQPGETLREFLKSFYQQNLLVKGEYTLDGRKVNLKNITCPLLMVYAENDHLVPPCSSKPLMDLVSSTEKKVVSLPTGHIGLYVSSKTQATLPPYIADWLKRVNPA